MSKVLSTKLTVDEIERFNTVAKQQGLSKAGLLKRLAQEYLDESNKVDRFSGVSEPNHNSSSKKGQLLEQYDSRNLPLASMATRSETDRIATIVEILGKRVEKHERWLNPQSADEVLLEMIGGPIGYLEKRIDNLSSSRQIKGSG